MNYWNQKEQRKIQAQEHTRLMQKKYRENIENSIRQTKVYSPSFVYNASEEKQNPKISVINTDSVSAIFKQPIEKKIAVLNFASYKNPGGMFFEGSSAQEESLCHESILYNVLQAFDDTYYAWNRKHKNNALYLNRALYSPNIIFERYLMPMMATIRNVDVITCAAPNYGTAVRWGNITKEENTQILKNRMYFIKSIAEQQHVDILILGAWGTGVFKQDKKEVAELFQDVFSKTTISEIVHPIPDENTFRVWKRFYE